MAKSFFFEEQDLSKLCREVLRPIIRKYVKVIGNFLVDGDDFKATTSNELETLLESNEHGIKDKYAKWIILAHDR